MMKENWTYKKLGEVCEILNGFAFKSDEYKDNGIRVMRITNVQKGAIVDDDPKFFPLERMDEVSKYILREGDVLMSLTGNVGRVGIITSKFLPAALNQRVACLRLRADDVNKKYLFHILNSDSFEKDCIFNAAGIAQKNMSTKWLEQYAIPVPPIKTQSRIVSELDLLQSIIDKQQAQLKELDNLAQSVFYDMFGDPVENEKGWPFAYIKDVCDSIVRGPFGSALKKEFFVESNDSTYKVYEQKHAIQKDATIGSYYIDNERFQSLKRFELKADDIIMSCSGTIGELFEIPLDAEKGIMNQALLKFTLNKSIDKKYFLFAMDFIKESFETKGTGLQNIGSVITIKNTKISLPLLSLQQSFAAKIESIEKQKSAISQSIEETQSLFDYTMDKYFG